MRVIICICVVKTLKLSKMETKGLVYIFTGDGKGKTSAAIGVTLRMLMLNKKVVWISWYKSPDWAISEMKLAQTFKENLEMYWMGKGFYIKSGKSARVNKAMVFDYDTVEGHKRAANEALQQVRDLINKTNEGQRDIDLIVMDEINQTVEDGLLSAKDIVEVMKIRGGIHLVLTGRKCNDLVLQESDLVTEMKKIKHPFDNGIMAVQGLDF